MIKKGIILAGGYGTRLGSLTKAVNKQLLPLYDKPLIYYPLSVLMLAGIRNILIITNKGEKSNFIKLLGDGSQLGIRITFLEQSRPKGLPDAFIVGEKFIGRENVVLILGDNFFYGQGFTNRLKNVLKKNKGATIFTYIVNNPSDYGILEIDKKNKKFIFNKKKSKNLLKGYSSLRKLSKDEKNSLNVLCRGAALRYLLTRTNDYLNTPKSAVIKIKNPREYIQKLKIHNKFNNFKNYYN